MSLPSFPVDDTTLDMLWSALNPRELDPEAPRTTVWDFLDMMSRMGGSDPKAIDHLIDHKGNERPYFGQDLEDNHDIRVMRDPMYHDHDVLRALIIEVRQLRAQIANQQ